jgi:hypothetical protein
MIRWRRIAQPCIAIAALGKLTDTSLNQVRLSARSGL